MLKTLELVKLCQHDFDVIEVDLQLLEQVIDSHELSVFLKLLLRQLQRLLHNLVLILQRSHIL